MPLRLEHADVEAAVADGAPDVGEVAADVQKVGAGLPGEVARLPEAGLHVVARPRLQLGDSVGAVAVGEPGQPVVGAADVHEVSLAVCIEVAAQPPPGAGAVTVPRPEALAAIGAVAVRQPGIDDARAAELHEVYLAVAVEVAGAPGAGLYGVVPPRPVGDNPDAAIGVQEPGIDHIGAAEVNELCFAVAVYVPRLPGAGLQGVARPGSKSRDIVAATGIGKPDVAVVAAAHVGEVRPAVAVEIRRQPEAHTGDIAWPRTKVRDNSEAPIAVREPQVDRIVAAEMDEVQVAVSVEVAHLPRACLHGVAGPRPVRPRGEGAVAPRDPT